MNFKKLSVAFLLGLAIAGGLVSLPTRSLATVSNQTTQTVTGFGDGTTVNFTPTFDFRSNSWVTVTLVDISAATSTVLSYGTGAGQFQISGGNPGTTVVMGTAPTTNQYLVIGRAVPLTQGVVFAPASVFPYAGISAQLDQIVLALQNVNSESENIEASTVNIQTASASPSPSYYITGVTGLTGQQPLYASGIYFDTSGTIHANVTGTAGGSLTRVNNLADLLSASTARTNLGLGTAALFNINAFLQPSNNLSDVSSTSTAFNTISPMTTGGDLIYGGTSGAATRLANGSSGQFLTSGGTTAPPTWTTLSTLANPMTTLGDTLYGGASGTATRLAGSTSSSAAIMTQTGNGTISAAPVWTAASSVTVGTATSATNATNGATVAVSNNASYFLGLHASATNSNQPFNLSSGLTFNPSTSTLTTTTVVAALTGHASADLQISNNLSDVGTKATAFNNLSPMTAAGDLIVGGTSGAGGRLAVGSNNNVLTVSGGLPVWASAPVSTTLTTKGDLQGFSTVNARVPVPGDYGHLIADAQQATGYRAATYTTEQHGRPGKNYVQYSDFENAATTGWTLGTVGTLTNGLPTGSPTFGSGASGSLSLAVESSGQLAGSDSLGYVSSAATTAGNMVASSSLPIDIADQAKVLSVRFSYSPVVLGGANFSGTSSNSYAWALWDVTNSVWLSCAGNFSLVQSAGVQTNSGGTCQTNATTANVRLAIYNATATTGAATLYLDDFYVGPQSTLSAPNVGDWTAFTPTGSWSTNTVYAGTRRRVGDTDEIDISIALSGAPTSASLSINLPAGDVIDTNKLLNGANDSSIGIVSGISGGNSFSAFAAYNTSTSIRVLYFSPSGVGGYNKLFGTNQAAPSTFASGDSVIIHAFVPIVGWSSNNVASSDTDTRVVNTQIIGSTPTGTIATSLASSASLNFGTATYDSHGAWNGTTTYTVPVSGQYEFLGTLMIGGTFTSGNYVDMALYKNGSSNTTIQNTAQGSVTQFRIPYIFQLSLSAGDAITLRAQSNATSPIGAANSTLFVKRLSGPAVITATESVNARYFSSSTTVSGTLATVIYSTKDWDTHNAYASGVYTCPVTGKYQVNASIAMTGTFLLNSILDLQVQQTGSSSHIAESKDFSGGAITQMNTNVGDIFYCLAGDTIKVQASNSGTTPVIAATTTQNWFSIARVGN